MMDDEVVGYLLKWVTPEGHTRRKWYQHAGRARNRAESLGKRGEAVRVRLLHTTDLTDISSELDGVYDPSLAEKRATWATSTWRKRVLRSEPGIADWLRAHEKVERALDWTVTRAGRTVGLALGLRRSSRAAE